MNCFKTLLIVLALSVCGCPSKTQSTTSVQGRIEISKSAIVAGHVIPEDELLIRFGEDWKARLADRTLRIRGEVKTHICDPRAQCFVGGKIPYFHNVTELGLLCSDGRTLIVPKWVPSCHLLSCRTVKTLWCD